MTTVLQTTKCIGCLGKVRWYSGHVIHPASGKEVSAGLCEVHGAYRDALPCNSLLGRAGCYGYWYEEYGIEEGER